LTAYAGRRSVWTVSVAVSCPRCGGAVRAPDLMSSEWRCDECGPVPPWHVAERIGPEILQAVADKASGVPMWCPWPLPAGWMVTGVGWAGDERTGTLATAIACSGPAPLSGGPADMLLVAEEPGVGVGTRYAGLPGLDPGPHLQNALANTAAHAKVKVDGWPTALWSVDGAHDRSSYIGEAKGRWLYAVAWPPTAGYLFADHLVLHDLTEWLPSELVFGAPSPYLHGEA
jgi:hypothetical protein